MPRDYRDGFFRADGSIVFIEMEEILRHFRVHNVSTAYVLHDSRCHWADTLIGCLARGGSKGPWFR